MVDIVLSDVDKILDREVYQEVFEMAEEKADSYLTF